MFARYKPWKVVASFASVGVLVAVPICARLVLSTGLVSFVASPVAILLIFKGWDLNWKFFVLAAPVNAVLYGAYGRLLVYLSKKL
jgi:hypothetical protein